MKNNACFIVAVFIVLLGGKQLFAQNISRAIDHPQEKKSAIKKPIVKSQPVTKDKVIVIGEAEYVKLSLGNTVLKARIDTGAKSTSVTALNIHEFERDGKKWVQFDLPDSQGKTTAFKEKMVGKILIKQHGREPITRPEIMATIELGSVKQSVKVNLADRGQYEYPVLIGRNFLEGRFSVDVSKKYTQELLNSKARK